MLGATVESYIKLDGCSMLNLFCYEEGRGELAKRKWGLL